MAGTVRRFAGQGVWTVIRFNWHLHALALSLVAAALVAAGFLDGSLRVVLLLAAAGLFLPLLLSLAATWVAYDAGGLYRLSWLRPFLAGAERGGNFHAGFDETTRLLRDVFPAVSWRVFDFYDPVAHPEISIRRARRAYPPAADAASIKTAAVPLPPGSLDVAVLFLSAHEIRNFAERARFFRELRRVLVSGGKVIVTEHLRDLTNILAYSVGAWHFHPRGTWLATFDAAGLRIVREFKNSPLITTFVLEADENAG